MNGVQAAIFSGSAMVLLVLVLRLLLKKYLPRCTRRLQRRQTVSYQMC